jgi:anti-sigma regulatory factor (Ser/Thr protein kinase)
VNGSGQLGQVSRDFAHHETSVGAARKFAAETAAAWGVADRVDDLRLCLSEVATNALLHAAPPACGFGVRLTVDREALRLEVHDRGGGSPVRRTPGDGDCTGRGLLLVDELADDWGVSDDPTGKTVWLIFKVARSHGG